MFLSVELALAEDSGHGLVEHDLIVVSVAVSHEVAVNLISLLELSVLLTRKRLLAVEAHDDRAEAHELLLHVRPGVSIELGVVVLVVIVHLTTVLVGAGSSLVLSRLLVRKRLVLSEILAHSSSMFRITKNSLMTISYQKFLILSNFNHIFET